MGIGNLGLIDCSNIERSQHKICNNRNPETVVKGPKFMALSSQLSETLGESVNITVANVPGNKTAVERYAAGCEQENNVTIAPNIAAKALKDPDKMEELQTAIQGYLEQCAEIDREGDQIERSGLVFIANGDSKTWAVTASAVEESTAQEETVAASDTEISKVFDYVFEKTSAIKHFSKYSEMMQLLLINTTEISSILNQDSSSDLVNEIPADAGIANQGADTGEEVEPGLTTGDTASGAGGEIIDESTPQVSAEEVANSTADGVEAVLA